MVKKPTMKEIARLAGVSRPSVSMILNNKPYSVTDETRERVLRIARELNYQPNFYARSLKKGKTGCIGFINCFSSSAGNALYYSEVIRGIEEAMARADSDYNLIMFGSTLERTFEKSRVMYEQGAVDGLILNILSQDIRPFEATVIPTLQESRVPFVVVHSTAEELAYPHVGLNTRRGGALAAEFFLKQGYDTIGVHPSIVDSLRCTEPVEGFVQALAKAGRTADDLQPVTGPSASNARLNDTQIDAILNTGLRCLFIPDDSACYRLLNKARARGTAVPGDLAVIGFDDIYTFPEPSCLTTLHHPFRKKGEAALRMLLRVLDGDLSETSELIDPWLMERETA